MGSCTARSELILHGEFYFMDLLELARLCWSKPWPILQLRNLLESLGQNLYNSGLEKEREWYEMCFDWQERIVPVSSSLMSLMPSAQNGLIVQEVQIEKFNAYCSSC